MVIIKKKKKYVKSVFQIKEFIKGIIKILNILILIIFYQAEIIKKLIDTWKKLIKIIIKNLK